MAGQHGAKQDTAIDRARWWTHSSLTGHKDWGRYSFSKHISSIFPIFSAAYLTKKLTFSSGLAAGWVGRGRCRGKGGCWGTTLTSNCKQFILELGTNLLSSPVPGQSGKTGCRSSNPTRNHCLFCHFFV